jgi:tRNA threonylcarbamoyladenosine biosynthesis protein TsaE
MNSIKITTQSPGETKQVGRSLGGVFMEGDLVALTGELGSGKTTLIQGICEGLGVQEKVTSPTFVIITTYKGRIPVNHFDLYRLEKREEFIDLGYEEFFFNKSVTLIEWSDKINDLLPSKRIDILLSRLKKNEREIVITSFGRKLEKSVAVAVGSRQ